MDDLTVERMMVRSPQGFGPVSEIDDIAAHRYVAVLSAGLAIDWFAPRDLAVINTIAVDDPFPAPSPEGRPRIALKNYSENEGLLDILSSAGIIRPTGRVLTQGYVKLPIVEVVPSEEERIHSCDECQQWETEGKRSTLAVRVANGNTTALRTYVAPLFLNSFGFHLKTDMWARS